MKQILVLSLVAILVASPTLSFGWMFYDAQAPDSSLLGNSFVDILYYDGTAWLASSKGLSATTDMGLTWVTYTSEVLNSDNPSAIFARPGQIWVAGSHFESFEGVNYPFGDGFNMSTDNGLTWQTMEPPEASNFGKLVYDITGNDISTFAACFHGGLIVSHDEGQSWRHIFYTPVDSLDWANDTWADSASGRFYSCQIDTFHADTTILLAGSARGLMKFLYLPKRVKLGGNQIYDILGVDSTVYLAHEGGVTRTVDSTINPKFTADTTNGLGSNLVRKLTYFGDRIWAGVFDSNDSSGLGLYYSLDSAETWNRLPVDYFDGLHSGVYDFKIYHDSTFYIAAGDSGAFRSIDSGQTWLRFFVDSSDMDFLSPRNQIYSLDLTSDSIYLGTRAGLVRAPYTNEPFYIDPNLDTVITFPENDQSGSFASLVRHYDGNFVAQDSSIIHYSFTWVGVEPQTVDGTPGGILMNSPGHDSVAIFARVNDITLIDPITSVIATEFGLTLSTNGLSPIPSVNLSVADPTTGLTLNSFQFLTVDQVGERLYTGSSYGFGYMISNNNWRVFRANTDPLRRDLAVARTYSNSGLPGDWVVAIDLQSGSQDTILWTACRRVPDTTGQINGVGLSYDFGASWTTVLPNIRVWNFAFDGDAVYAAGSEGLYYAEPPYADWTRLSIVDPVTQDTMISGTEIYSAAVVEGEIWVGAELGLARLDRGAGDVWTINRNFKETESEDEVFAAPVPFSPVNFNGRLSIHYHVATSTDVTVEIYDFAMNLVKRITENRPRSGGADYFESWDGYNEEGDMAATGIYYIRIKFSSGEERWGRLAIVP